MKIRTAAYAGTFYPGTPAKLRNEIENLVIREKGNLDPLPFNKPIIGGIVPHAGYIYSGYHAIHFFEAVKKSGQIFDTAVIVNPNHSGYGPSVAIDENDAWETPFGKVTLDLEFIFDLPYERTSISHRAEHSGEVMLPFLQYFMPYPLKIIPISVNHQTLFNAKDIAENIFLSSKKLNRKILFIASSDFSHFLSPEKGFDLDQLILDEIINLNSPGIEEKIHRHDISVCGYCPIMALIEYSKVKSGSPGVIILRRGHSGEINVSSRVVDYITLLFFDNA